MTELDQPAQQQPKRPSVREWAVAWLVVAVYCGVALYGVSRKSTTSDEVAHIAAGYSYWVDNDFRLQPENGNWPQRWVSIPMAVGRRKVRPDSLAGWGKSDVWTIADHLFYDSGYDADTLLRNSRRMAVVIGGLVALVAFAWSATLFGLPGAWITLVVTCLSPTMLAHGALATSDMMATLFFTVSCWAIWRALFRVTPVSLLACIVTVSGLLLSKFSAPILLPIAGTMIVARLMSREPMVVALGRFERHVTTRKGQLASAGLVALGVAAIGIGVVWGSYGFRYSAMSPSLAGGDFLVPWSTLLGELGTMGRLIDWSRDHHLLPEAYLYGFSQTAYYARHRVAFFNGRYSDVGGWIGFFPFAAVVKETIPVLLLVIGAAALAISRWFRADDERSWAQRARSAFFMTAPLWSLIIVYWAFALNSNLNIGQRHLLPTIPATYVLLGSLGSLALPGSLWIARFRRYSIAGLTALLLWNGVETFRIAPNFLAYFNELIGGPSQGYRHLVDSSLDWGQDLPGLKSWLNEQGLQGPGHQPVYLSYFGNARPEYYGIDAIRLPGFPRRQKESIPQPLTGGVYCISATMYQGIYLDAPPPWTAAYQQQFDAALFNLRVFDSTAAKPADRARLIKQTGEDFWWRTFDVFEQLRLARLTTFLRRRQPDAEIGYSILIFRLTDDDVRAALTTPF